MMDMMSQLCESLPSGSLKDVTAPEVAIIIPVFKHSGLIGEAINSALEQDALSNIRIVIVNDGCPFPETEETCLAFAAAYPDYIVYLRQTNGGLSAARNTGIDYSIERWPTVEAVYLLDADNRLGPSAISSALGALRTFSNAGWIYPDITMFGLEWNGSYAGDYSILLHTSINISEAGSLLSRKVLDAGVRFDETMRLGYEDWDFFLQAASAGFRGHHCPGLILRYRKRVESMLSDSIRDDGEILAHLRRKHAKLLHPRNLVALEHVEAPRYALIKTDLNIVDLVTDPGLSGRRVTLDEFDRMLWSHWSDPSQFGAPPFILFTHSSAVNTLQRLGMLHNTLGTIEKLLDVNGVALCRVINGETSYRVSVVESHHDADKGVEYTVSAITISLLRVCVLDSAADWLNSLSSRDPHFLPPVLEVAADLRDDVSLPYTGALTQLLSFFWGLRNSPFRFSVDSQPWKERGCGDRSRLYRKVREELGEGAVAWPRVVGAEKNLGFILPILSFGGVEKVAVRLGEVLKAEGWNVHLFLFGTSEALITPEWQAVADSVTFLTDLDCNLGSDQTFNGTHLSAYANSHNKGTAVGQLYWLDAVVNCQSAAANVVMAQLRRLKVKTFAFPHVADQTAYSRPVGHPYLTLGYEHAYDGILTCSYSMANWLAGMGVPRFKIIPVPNAPGYLLAEDAAAAIMHDRLRESRTVESLNVLFLGRLDRQKGIDRLVSVVRQCRESGMPIEWRIVGKGVLTEDSAETLLEPIAYLVEPPAISPEALTDLYAWADVLVILSYWEGLPLTILEAARVGCVSIATDVGAVREAVEHDKTGFLLQQNPIEECVMALRQLTEDPTLLHRLADAAYKASLLRTWKNSAQTFIDRLFPYKN